MTSVNFKYIDIKKYIILEINLNVWFVELVVCDTEKLIEKTYLLRMLLINYNYKFDVYKLLINILWYLVSY